MWLFTLRTVATSINHLPNRTHTYYTPAKHTKPALHIHTGKAVPSMCTVHTVNTQYTHDTYKHYHNTNTHTCVEDAMLPMTTNHSRAIK